MVTPSPGAILLASLNVKIIRFKEIVQKHATNVMVIFDLFDKFFLQDCYRRTLFFQFKKETLTDLQLTF